MLIGGFQIVIVVVLLSLDFWNVRVCLQFSYVISLETEIRPQIQNVAGRTLVGLRYWNEVDEEGESSWVFECRDVSQSEYAALMHDSP